VGELATERADERALPRGGESPHRTHTAQGCRERS
jgi:hypothetical protein